MRNRNLQLVKNIYVMATVVEAAAAAAVAE